MKKMLFVLLILASGKGSAQITSDMNQYLSPVKAYSNVLMPGIEQINDNGAIAGECFYRSPNSSGDTLLKMKTGDIAGNFTVLVRLKIDQITSWTTRLCRIKLKQSDGTISSTDLSIDVYPYMFKNANEWQIFSIAAEYENGLYSKNFLITDFNQGIAGLYIDYLYLIPGNNKSYYSKEYTITTKGNVGIGTMYPKTLLDIKPQTTDTLSAVLGRLPEGDTVGNGSYIGFRTGNATANATSFSLEHRFYNQLNSSIDFHRGDSMRNGFMAFTTNNGAERMRINAAGNVGIGTINPTERLSVDGNIRTRKLIVTQTGWPDYVFDSAYQLQSLDAVADFIQKNKRLPGMPSAATVEKSGQDVGDVQKVLLQKMEEMTLYMIQQQQTIKALKERISVLEKEKAKKQ